MHQVISAEDNSLDINFKGYVQPDITVIERGIVHAEQLMTGIVSANKHFSKTLTSLHVENLFTESGLALGVFYRTNKQLLGNQDTVKLTFGSVPARGQIIPGIRIYEGFFDKQIINLGRILEVPNTDRRAYEIRIGYTDDFLIKNGYISK